MSQHHRLDSIETPSQITLKMLVFTFIERKHFIYEVTVNRYLMIITHWVDVNKLLVHIAFNELNT